jgi:hypothetical protein
VSVAGEGLVNSPSVSVVSDSIGGVAGALAALGAAEAADSGFSKVTAFVFGSR